MTFQMTGRAIPLHHHPALCHAIRAPSYGVTSHHHPIAATARRVVIAHNTVFPRVAKMDPVVGHHHRRGVVYHLADRTMAVEVALVLLSSVVDHVIKVNRQPDSMKIFRMATM